MELTFLDLAIFVAFLVAVVFVGLLKSREEKDSEAYFLAGRGLSWWLIGFSLIAANISAEQFVGMSGQAAKDNVGLAIASYEWIAAITLVGVAFFFLPKFLRSGIYTIPEYLEYRYNHAARTLMSLLMVAVLVTVNITTVTYLGAKALAPLFSTQTVFGRPVDLEMLCWVVGVSAAIYVAAGGLKACAWADLLQGTALIAGGAVVMVLAFLALDRPERFGLDPAAVGLSGQLASAPLVEKFQSLNGGKMSMVLSADNPELPWTALVIGIWIPNVYYWGLNQYIMQRTLGAKSLAHGQNGIVFAAGLKLIMPFIVCIPGIIAFNLYKDKMHEAAMGGAKLNADVLARFERVESDPTRAGVVFPFNHDFAALRPDLAERILAFNSRAVGVELRRPIGGEALLESVRSALAPRRESLTADWEKLESGHPAQPPAARRAAALRLLNKHCVALATDGDRPGWRKAADWLQGRRPAIDAAQELVGYDHDGAFPMLIRYLTPHGLRGFVVAALMGAVISSLAAMLNAASTIFTMDLYREYLHRGATQRALVWAGRATVLVAVLVGCSIAPLLERPKFQGAFHFIQEFQGYISPGVLTIFLFGLFVPRVPRAAGAVGLIVSPIVYGVLHVLLGHWAFLNRMALTVAVVGAVLLVMTLVRPLGEPVRMPVQTKIEMVGSRAAVLFGLLVVAATVALYVVFW